MKAVIKEVKMYEIEIDGVPVGRFSFGSAWNGLTEFNSPDGTVIVGEVTLSPVDFFSSLFTSTSVTSEERSSENVQVFSVSQIIKDAIDKKSS